MHSFYGILTIVGPILLLAVLGWTMYNNRTTRAEREHSEAATRRMYDEQNAADTAAEAPVEGSTDRG